MSERLEDLVGIAVQSRVQEALDSDPGFLRQLMEDPKGAYRARFGEELMPGEEIEPMVNPDGSVALVVPRLQKGVILTGPSGAELSEEELELVSGGSMCCVGGDGTGCCGNPKLPPS